MQTPEGKRLRETLEAFERGEVGRSVKDFKLTGKSAGEIDRAAVEQGFKKKIRPLPGSASGISGFRRRDGSIATKPDDPEVLQQVFYEHPDGGMIRVKPGGDPRPDPLEGRAPPHVSKSVKFEKSGGSDWSNEAFKVGDNGQPLPKSPNISDKSISRDLRRETDKKKVEDIQDAIADASHINIKVD